MSNPTSPWRSSSSTDRLVEVVAKRLLALGQGRVPPPSSRVSSRARAESRASGASSRARGSGPRVRGAGPPDPEPRVLPDAVGLGDEHPDDHARAQGALEPGEPDPPGSHLPRLSPVGTVAATTAQPPRAPRGALTGSRYPRGARRCEARDHAHDRKRTQEAWADRPPAADSDRSKAHARGGVTVHDPQLDPVAGGPPEGARDGAHPDFVAELAVAVEVSRLTDDRPVRAAGGGRERHGVAGHG